MAKTLGLLFIHGMGATKEGYSNQLQKALKKSIKKEVWQKVCVKEIYYQPYLQKNQEKIFNASKKSLNWLKLRQFILYGFSDAASLEHKKENVGSEYYLTQLHILKLINEIYDECNQISVPIIIVAQSLGCQVISNYIWDGQDGDPYAGIWKFPPDATEIDSPLDKFRRLTSLQAMYTTGCNIPIFVAGHSEIKAIKKPNKLFKWFNFFDKDDVLGWPLKPLLGGYEVLVEDIKVNAGNGPLTSILKSWTPLSHSEYWADEKIIKHLTNSIKKIIRN